MSYKVRERLRRWRREFSRDPMNHALYFKAYPHGRPPESPLYGRQRRRAQQRRAQRRGRIPIAVVTRITIPPMRLW